MDTISIREDAFFSQQLMFIIYNYEIVHISITVLGEELYKAQL